MKKFYLMLAAIVALSGCAGLQKKEAAPTYGDIQKSRLETAKMLLRENKIPAATDILAEICAATGVAGVTDEALFRRALLYLDGDNGKNDVVQARHTLERLQKEYPASSWRNHAASISGLMADQSRKIRSLKGENLSLIRENRELRLNIEKLKILDIEQELKGKR